MNPDLDRVFGDRNRHRIASGIARALGFHFLTIDLDFEMEMSLEIHVNPDGLGRSGGGGGFGFGLSWKALSSGTPEVRQ